jgi:cytidylate kinase
MDAIILSGLPAVGKTTVAKLVAQKLGLNVVGGGDILKEIASEAGVKTTGDDWWDTPEGIQFLEARKKSERFDKEVDQRLLKRVEAGDVVITSYTIPWLSKKGIKVWLSGSPDSRAERMAARDCSDKQECKKVIAIRDEENRKIYKKLYGIDFGRDLTPFDIVVGTDGIPASNVAEDILRQLRKKQ